MAKRLLVIATALATASCSSLQAFETREFGSDGVLPSAPSSWSAGNGEAGAELARDWVASLQDERLSALIDEAFDAIRRWPSRWRAITARSQPPVLTERAICHRSMAV